MDFFTASGMCGIFLFNMKGRNDLLHSICVDKQEGEGFIYNSSEPYAIKLSDRSLKLCVGDYYLSRCMPCLLQVVRSASCEGFERNRKRPSRSERTDRKRAVE